MTRLHILLTLSVFLAIACSDPRPSPECESAADCNDGDDCTADACDPANKTCSNLPVVDGTRCDFDGVPGVCISGACGEGPCAEVDCNDDNECTDDVCDFADGTCSNRPLSDRTSCDFDGTAGICIAGDCIVNRCAGDPCDDGNDCTNDFCDPNDGTCTNTPVEDFQYCSLDGGIVPDGGVGPDGGIGHGYCLQGVCVQDLCFGVPCDDSNPCTFDSCSPEDGSCTHTDRVDGTPCMDDLGSCMGGVCVVLPVCGDGRAIPGTAKTDQGSLTCEVQLGGMSAGIILRMAAAPVGEIQRGENELELQVEFRADSQTVNYILSRGFDVLRVESAAATIDATMGDSDPTPAVVEEAPVPCTMSLEPETAAAFVSPPVNATWTLDVGDTLELTLQQFEEELIVFGNVIRLSTVGPSANCVWETDLPNVSFTMVP